MNVMFQSAAASHPGTVRSSNQDRFVDRPDLGLWAVADGAGGHAGGEIAAGTLVDALEKIPAGLSAGELMAQVRLSVIASHQALRHLAGQRGPDTIMATTLVVLLARDDHFACLWAGDSRAYLLRNGELRQLTRDHSLVQDMVDAGHISADAAETHPQSNIITRAVGASEEPPELDKVIGRVVPGDRFLLCSDGLFKALANADAIHGLSENTPKNAVDTLIARALAVVARDNVTAVSAFVA